MNNTFPVLIVSGGQTGANRAALDFAKAHGISHAGFCPKGRKAEDGRIPDDYNLDETPSAAYPERTKLNVEMADATVIFDPPGHSSHGSALSARHAKKIGKPCAVLPHFPDLQADGALLGAFLEQHGPQVLNVAGSRESAQPGMHAYVEIALMAAALKMEPAHPSVAVPASGFSFGVE